MLSKILHLVLGTVEVGASESSKDFGVAWTWVPASLLPLLASVFSRPRFPPLLNGHHHSTYPIMFL